ncbi:MAG: cyclase family protein [Armatimonadota bacterium]
MTVSFSRIIDITQPLFDNCPGNPAFPPMEVLHEMRAEDCGWNTERLNFFTHVGTHIDSPWHRDNEGRTIDTMPPDAFIGPATAIDLYNKKPNEGILVPDMEPYADALKPIVLLCTGWGEKRANTDEYLYHSPWLTPEGASWLVEHGVRGVCIDHFSIGGAHPDRVAAPHDILLNAGIWILEDLIIPREVLDLRNLHVIALALLLKGGSGAPARALAAEY